MEKKLRTRHYISGIISQVSGPEWRMIWQDKEANIFLVTKNKSPNKPANKIESQRVVAHIISG